MKITAVQETSKYPSTSPGIVRVSQSLYNWRSVSQSVSHLICPGVQSLQDSWPDYGCSQLRFCHGAFSPSRRRVYLVTGHSPCLCQATYTYVHFELFKTVFFKFLLLLFLNFQHRDLHVHARPVRSGFVQQITPTVHLLPKDIQPQSRQLFDRMPDRHQDWAFCTLC